MSAPDSYLQKQWRDHKIPMISMALVVLFGAILILLWLIDESAQSNPPPQPDTSAQPVAPVPQVDPRLPPSAQPDPARPAKPVEPSGMTPVGPTAPANP